MKQMLLRLLCVFVAGYLAAGVVAGSAVPQGSPVKAQAYYKKVADVLEFRTSASIFDSTLDDVLTYTGYAGLSARDLQRLASNVLMDSEALGKPCPASSAVQAGAPCGTAPADLEGFKRAFSIRPLRSDDILASRFFAPKIIDVSQPPERRPLGWRKLVRLRARDGSDAAKHGIDAAVILFNFFTDPGVRPFGPSAESVNTQVMLISDQARFSAPDAEMDALYWLDYGRLSGGGKLSLQLDASFDAADLQAPGGTKPYYVPDGCVACHGEHPQRALVNYLDTDHWFDRSANDFIRVQEEGLPVLVDAGTNDVTTVEFARAFDVIRRFNEEASRQAATAQPKAFHRAASETWLRLHEQDNHHFPPIERSAPSVTAWNHNSETEKQLIDDLNRYCFRCHGTIKFNVFDKAALLDRRALIPDRLSPTREQLRADPNFLMPPDRKLEPAERDRILRLIRALEIPR